jgi:GntR family transcriptional regulator
VVGRPGQGTFVAQSLEQVDLAKLRRSLLGWLTRASSAGLDEDGIVALFTTTL